VTSPDGFLRKVDVGMERSKRLSDRALRKAEELMERLKQSA